MKDVNVILGERIKQGRKTNNITRERLAEMVDVSPRFLAEVEAGKVGVSLQTLKNISIALSLPTDFLLGLTNENQPSQIDSLCLQLGNIDEKYLPLISVITKELNKLD